jgi:hypothetical protein
MQESQLNLKLNKFFSSFGENEILIKIKRILNNLAYLTGYKLSQALSKIKFLWELIENAVEGWIWATGTEK